MLEGKGIDMGRKVKIASFAFNCGYLWGTPQEELIPVILYKLATVQHEHPDLVILPESVLRCTGAEDRSHERELNQLLLEMMRQKAAEMKSYIILSGHEPVEEYPELLYNLATIIDREGKIVGKYRKVHNTVGELNERNALPGKEYPVFDLDFGRIGIQICFDIDWREGWQKLADQGAELVVWTAAYDGGTPLNVYAAYHRYHIATSVWSNHAKIIGITGHTIAESSEYNGVALATIDLDTTLFHVDNQFQKLEKVRADLGEKITIRGFTQENIFTLTSHDDEWPISRICETYGLVTFKDYHAEATAVQEEYRKKYPTL